MMPQRNQEKDSNGVNLVLNLGARGSGKKKFDFYRQISEKFQFFQAILQKNIEFCRQILIFFRQLKNSIFQAKHCPFTATSGQIILFLFKSNHFRTYFLYNVYMIRYNNISRPVHDSNDPPATLPATPLPKIWGPRPSAPRTDAS